MSTTKQFKKGDLVFAKVRGYPSWPAKIDEVVKDSPNTKRFTFSVSFYGTGQTGKCKLSDIVHFNETKQELGTPKKVRHFNDAMRAIEAENEALNNTPACTDDTESIDETKKALPEKRTLKRLSNSSYAGARKKVYNEPGTSLSNSLADDLKEIGLAEEVKSEPPVSCASQGQKRFSLKGKTPIVLLKQVKSNEEEEDEYLLSDDNDEDENENEDEDYEIDSQQEEEDLELARDIGQRLSRKSRNLAPRRRPTVFFPTLVDQGDNLVTLIMKKSDDAPLSGAEKLRFWETELKLVQAEKKFKAYLARDKVEGSVWKKGEKNAEKRVEKTVREKLRGISNTLVLLEELEGVMFEPFVLKKQPCFVDTINKLRRYVGCVGSEELDPDEREKFEGDIAKIRAKACALFARIQSCFSIPEGANFCEWYKESALHLRRLFTLAADFLPITREPKVIDIYPEAVDENESSVDPEDIDDSESQALPKDGDDSESQALLKDGDDSESQALPKDGYDSESQALPKDDYDSESQALPKDGYDSESQALPKDGYDSESQALPKDGDDSESQALRKDGDDSGSQALLKDGDDSESQALPKDCDESESQALPKAVDGSESQAVPKDIHEKGSPAKSDQEQGNDGACASDASLQVNWKLVHEEPGTNEEIGGEALTSETCPPLDCNTPQQ